MIALAEVVPDSSITRRQLCSAFADIEGKTDRVFVQENIAQKKQSLSVFKVLVYVLAKEFRGLRPLVSFDRLLCVVYETNNCSYPLVSSIHPKALMEAVTEATAVSIVT